MKKTKITVEYIKDVLKNINPKYFRDAKEEMKQAYLNENNQKGTELDRKIRAMLNMETTTGENKGSKIERWGVKHG